MKKKISLFIIFFLLIVFLPKSVRAAEYGGLGAFPATADPANPLTESWFIYNLINNEEKQDAIIIKNTSDRTLSAKIYPVDGTTTKDGSFTLKGENEAREGVGSWVQTSVDIITLSPGQEQRVPFTIRIPGNAQVGDHTGGIVLENADVNKGKGVNVVTRVGVRIYETIPGQLIRKLEISEFSWDLVDDKIVFYFGLENKGNTVQTPTGKLLFENSILGGNGQFDLNLGTVLQDKPTRVPVVWKETPLIGKVKGRAVVNFGEGPNDKLEREISFTYVTKKAKIIAGLAVLVLASLFVLPSFRRRKK